MARVTIEDCLQVIPSRFDLVLLAAQRATQIRSGAGPLLVEGGNEKPPLTSLKEIAAGYTQFEANDLLNDDSIDDA